MRIRSGNKNLSSDRRSLCIEKLEPRHVLSAANLVISEFMASNASTLADGDGEYSDWIEVHNREAFSVNLADYFLTDDEGDLTRWAFPSTTLPAGGYMVVFASSPIDDQSNPFDEYVDGTGNPHANFSLTADKEYLALTYRDPLSLALSVVHEYAPEYPPQRGDISFGLGSVGEQLYFDVPTPGAANGIGYPGFVSDTKFSVDRGFYDSPFLVAITSDTPNADIYYTTNGDLPTPATANLYAGALTIDHTTVLRAVAYHEGLLPTNVDTQTYLFLNDIVQQTRQSTLDAGFPSTWAGYPADYGLDPDVIGLFNDDGTPIGGDNYQGVYAALLEDSLLSLPTISIVADVDDIFGSTGIYSYPTATGTDWERAASVEWITPDGSQEFQLDAGLRIQGGYFRANFASRKHSFRLLFKNEYGPSSLEFPLFAGAVDSYNTIVLRAGANDGYSWDAARFTEQFIRDEFGRILQNASGHPSAHGNFAHLYINGIYWGLYNPTERPDEQFAASYLGGNPDNWDSIHVDELSAGDFAAWSAMLTKAQQAGSLLAAYMELQGLTLDGSPSQVAPLLNVDSYIDYLTVNVWGGNWDWPWKNWWAGRDRADATTTGFEFFNWDFENVMGNNRSRSPLNATTLDQDFTGFDNAGQAHTYLKSNPEYRLAFADHIHRLFFNNGLLTPDNLIPMYRALADWVELAIVSESARWGDMHYPTPLTQAEWFTERDWILNEYLPHRSDIVLQEFKNFGLYPNIVAPTFNQHGGEITAGFQLNITAPAGEIWYTLDGSDPRLIGGELNPAAMQFTGTPVALSPGVTARARTRSAGEWSALNEATFIAPSGDVSGLRITELQYHPALAEEHEFIEITNTGTESVSLDGVKIASFASEPYEFAAGLTLAAGERIVVARNPTEFTAHYGVGINLAPTGYANANLSNGGETISLVGPNGQVLQRFTYDDMGDWPATADGGGPSLEYVGPLDAGEDPQVGAPDDPFDDPANWRASLVDGGTPGYDGNAIVPSADFNGDLTVNGGDFLLWQRGFGGSGGSLGAGDADLDGDVDATDLGVWQSQYGDSLATAPLLISPHILEDGTALPLTSFFDTTDVSQYQSTPFWVALPAEQSNLANDELQPYSTLDSQPLPVKHPIRDDFFSELGSEILELPRSLSPRSQFRRIAEVSTSTQLSTLLNLSLDHSQENNWT